MDPASIVGLVLSLTSFCGKAVAGVNSLKEAYDDSNLSLTSLAAECATLGAALTVLEGTLSRQSSSKSASDTKRLFGEDGAFTEALQGSIKCCFMTMSELQDEIAEIQKHSGSLGSLNARGKVGYVLNEGRINQLAGLLRGQSSVLTTLETIMQRKSLEDIEKMMRRHQNDVRRVYAESERSWKNRNQGAQPPRSLAEASSILNSDTVTFMSSRVFDFDDIAVNATAYRNVMSRALNSRNTRNGPSRGANLDHDEEEGLPSLFRAIKTLNSESVLLLLRQGEDPNQVDDSGMSPLQRCAALAGPHAARIASSLVLHGADIDAHRAGTGMTALRVAAKSGNLFVVKALLGMGADPCVRDRLGAQAIHAAVQFGHCDIVECLLGNCDDHGMSEHGISSAVQAAMWDDKNLERDSDCTLLHFAAVGTDADEKMIELLLQCGLEPEAHSRRGMTALQYAMSRRNSDVANCLVRHGCDIVPEILHYAERGELELIMDVANSVGLDTANSQGRTAASLAAEQGWSEALRILLDKGASATHCDASGRSPLFWSLHFTNNEAVEICMLKKPTLSQEDVSEYLKVVMSSSASSKSAKDRLVELLLTSPDESVRLWVREKALDNDWPDVLTRTLRTASDGDGDVEDLFKRAVEMSRHGVVGTLLSMKGSGSSDPEDNVNLQLIWAIEAGQVTIVKYLLEHGATPWGRRCHPSSPLLAACSSRDEAVTKLVLHHLLLAPESARFQGASTPFLDHMKEQSILTFVIKSGLKRLLPLFPWRIINRYDYVENGLSLLTIVATTTGDLDTARLLLRLGVSANSCSYWSPPEPRENGCLFSGDTALSVAIQLDMPDLAALLLRHGAEVDCKRRVPLGIYRHAFHCDPEVRHSEGGTVEESPLISVLRCAQRNAARLVEVLLKHGADVNLSPAFLITIGDFARMFKFKLIQDPKKEVGALWRIRRNRDTFVELTPLMFACINGDPWVVKILLSNRRINLSLNATFGPIHLVVMSNDATLLNTLLADGRFDVDDTDAPEFCESPTSMDCFIPVCLAALGGLLEPLQFLITHGSARIEAQGVNIDDVCAPLCLAAYRGHAEVVEYLLGIGARLSKNDATFAAARDNDSLTAILQEELARREAPVTEQEAPARESAQNQLLRPLGTSKKRTLGRKLSALLRREKLTAKPSQVTLETVQEVSKVERHSVVVSEEQVLASLLPETRHNLAMEEILRQRANMLESHGRNLR